MSPVWLLVVVCRQGPVAVLLFLGEECFLIAAQLPHQEGYRAEGDH
jgi:hypothetical protein